MEKKTEAEKQKLREKQRRYRNRHPDKKAARKYEENLQKQPCIECLKNGVTNLQVEFHHPDHKNPYKGVWLCKTHHEQEDTRLDRERKNA